MRSTFITVIIAVLIIGALVVGGYFVFKKFNVSADVESQTKSADLNNDGKIDGLDLNVLLNAISDKSENPKFDLNGDGKIDSSDADELSRQWKE